MGYRVALFNYYADGSREVAQCDTESVLLHDARMDVEIEMFTQLMHNGRNYNERPTKQHFVAWPAQSLRR